MLPGHPAAAAVDPSVVTGTPWLRAAVAFVLVVPFGVAILSRYGGLVERSVETSMGSPLVSVLYGFLTQVGLLFVGGVLSTQLANAGLGTTTLTVGSTVVFGVVFLTLAGLGFAVVGAWLVERRGAGPRWQGLGAVAAVGAAGWLLPALLGTAIWVGLVSVGIGGPTRKWIHAEQSVEAGVDRQ
jgi:hypothetical protein